MVLLLLLSLGLTLGSVQSQGSSQDAFIIQYLERRLVQMEERLSLCEQNTVSATQKTYDLSSEVRGYLSTLSSLRSEVKSQVDSVSVRVDRVERELEYLENKIPTQSNIEMEEALLEQQIKAVELEQLKKKAKINVVNDCNTVLSQVKSLKIVKKSGDPNGCWFKDPSEGSNKVYLFSGFHALSALMKIHMPHYVKCLNSDAAAASTDPLKVCAPSGPRRVFLRLSRTLPLDQMLGQNASLSSNERPYRSEFLGVRRTDALTHAESSAQIKAL
ncbi:olfactomedin-like protein 3A [Xiphophorus maculatus]|uniref:olfactomedin-like protein 3A n=1 Tax=Xiphophorus maculatus TaxID=8083 RepID=UPI000C6E7DE6|nr:olfactomedin-like protein 3A [Xiphophorus maculatus]